MHFVWLISKRELRDQLRDWRILLPLGVLTIGFPFLMNAFAYGAVEFVNQYGGTLLIDRLVPFSILIIGFFPLTISLLGALESFVGEKERGTIEPLLSSPLADWQLYIGKLIVGIITPLASSFISITIYLVMVSRQDLNMPEPIVFIQLFLLTIAHALLMVSAAILFSTQSTSVKAANLLASFIVVPVAMLMMGESVLLFWLNNEVLWSAVVAVTIVAGLLVRLGLAHFQREALLGREIDVLNLRWMWKTFWKQFRGEARFRKEYLADREGESKTRRLWRKMRGTLVGGARAVFDWYALSLRDGLAKLRKPMLILFLIALLSGPLSYFWSVTALPKIYSAEERAKKIAQIRQEVGLGESSDGASPMDEVTAPMLFLYNLRATMALAFMGIFSFGVLGITIYIINFAMDGIILGIANMAGIPFWPMFLAGVLPHGIFEIPALMLSSAAVMQIGLILVTPQTHKTVGEVFIEGIADWAKVALGAVVPLLAAAAAIETYVTPKLLCLVLSCP
jgi:uncharacterized membrane protein SpoIIM required for sporulation/ABC-type transport system involved in multi-copper enzyme maturation permease subunit